MTDKIPFSSRGYASLLAAFAARGYLIRNFSDADPSKPHLILRHDVDMSVATAAEMAETVGSVSAPRKAGLKRG